MNYKKFSSVNLVIFSVILYLLAPQLLNAQYSKNELKAAYLEKFTLFIEWPYDSTSADSTQPFIIGVFKDKSFSTTLKEIYKNRKIQNREVQIEYFANFKKIHECHLLFISESKEDELQTILSRLGEKPILLISDTEGFAEKGIHIDFFLEKDKLKFEINQAALKKSGLKASYQLLQLARVVKTKGVAK